MANEINIDGNDNVVLSQVTGSHVTVNQFLAKSQEYGTLQDRLAELRDMLGFIPAEEGEKRRQIAAKISTLEEEMKSFQQNVISLAKTFKALEEKPEISINNTRLEKAKEHFIAGNFTAARVLLEQDIEAINDEGKVLLGHKAEFEEKEAEFKKELDWYAANVQPKLEYKAYEYLILAQTTALNYESPTRVADTKKYFEDSIECIDFFGNLSAYGKFLFNCSEFKSAIDFWGRALEVAKKNNDRHGQERCLGNLGFSYIFLGEYQKAIEFQEQSLKIAQEIGDRLNEGHILGFIGSTYQSLGEFRKAIEFHEQMFVITREMGDQLGEGVSLGNLGLIYNYLGEHDKAIEFQMRRLKIARKIGDRLGEEKGLGNLGVIYNSLGKYKEAIYFYEQAVKISQEIGDRHGEGWFLGNLGGVFNCLGEYQKAIDFNERALKVKKEIGDRDGEGAVLDNLGSVYLSLGECQKAIKFTEQALSICLDTENLYGKGCCLQTLGSIYKKLEEIDKAWEHWRQALAVFEIIDVPEAEKVRKLMQQAGCPEKEAEDEKQETE